MKFQAISEIIETMDPSSPACKCGDKAPCPCNREELRQLLKEQLKEADYDTTHGAYTEGDFKKIPCTHRSNEVLHHHKDCGRVIGEHDPVSQDFLDLLDPRVFGSKTNSTTRRAVEKMPCCLCGQPSTVAHILVGAATAEKYGLPNATERRNYLPLCGTLATRGKPNGT